MQILCNRRLIIKLGEGGYMIITIARECGCNGDDIGRFLAEKYNIPCYTKKELEKIAKEEHIYEKYPFFFNEVSLELMMDTVADEMKQRLRNTPKEALGKTAKNGDFVIIGRASNYAFRDRDDVVRIFLCGEKKQRIRNIAIKHNVSERKAGIIVDETDNRRRSYHKYYTGEEWGYAGNYDMCLDAIKLEKTGIGEMIDEYLKLKNI